MSRTPFLSFLSHCFPLPLPPTSSPYDREVKPFGIPLLVLCLPAVCCGARQQSLLLRPLLLLLLLLRKFCDLSDELFLRRQMSVVLLLVLYI